MDVSHLTTAIHPAPRAVFDRLTTHRHRVRFHVRDGGAWQPVTWGQFALQIRGVARWPVAHELEPGERVAIYAPNSVAWASAAPGAQTAGAVFVPIYPASTADQISYILEHAEIKYCFAGNDQIARLERARALVALPPEVLELDTAAWPSDAPVTDERSFRAAAARQYCIEINRLENRIDRDFRDALGKLFEEVTDPILIIKWKEVYEHLEDASDKGEDVANVLEAIVLKYA